MSYILWARFLWHIQQNIQLFGSYCKVLKWWWKTDEWMLYCLLDYWMTELLMHWSNDLTTMYKGNWLLYWTTDWLTKQLTDGITAKLTPWVAEWVSFQPTTRLIYLLTYWLTYRLMNLLTLCLTDWQADLRSNYLTGWLVNLLTDQLLVSDKPIDQPNDHHWLVVNDSLSDWSVE